MPRIRSVHPAICTDDTLADVSASGERTFTRLWTQLDDEGRAEANPKLLKASLYPLHDAMTVAKVAADVDELVRHGLLIRYEVRGKRYLSAKPSAWAEWQKPRHPSPSKLPGLDDPDATICDDDDTGSERRNGTAKRRNPHAVVGGEKELEVESSLPAAVQPAGDRPALVVDDADRLTKAFWNDANPKPAVKFIALRKIVERFLEAGWPPTDVAKALRRTRAFTVDAIEFTLREKAAPQNKNIPVLQDFVARDSA